MLLKFYKEIADKFIQKTEENFKNVDNSNLEELDNLKVLKNFIIDNKYFKVENLQFSSKINLR